MQYETFEGDMFFSHRVWLTINGNRIKELDEHLQTYGRRSIDWEIDSQVKKKKSNTLLDMRKFRGRQWVPEDKDYTNKDHIRFRRKSDAVRFKLSWDECVIKADDQLLAMFKKLNLNSMYTTWAPPSFKTRYGMMSQGIEPLSWFSKRGGVGVNIDGQYELDFDGKFAEAKNKVWDTALKFLDFETDYLDHLYPHQIKVYKDRNRTGASPVIAGYKGTIIEDKGMSTNLCAEIPLPGPASSSDSSSYDEGGEAA